MCDPVTDTNAVPPPAGESHDLLSQVSRLIETANAINFEVTDRPGSLTMAAVSAPTILSAVQKAVAVLDEMERYYDGVSDPETADTLFDIGELISSEMAAREITDLAFIAGRELRTCAEQLERSIADEDLVAMVSGCDAALRRLRRGLIPIEAAMCEFEGISPPLRRWVDLEVSLRIRRLYAQFERAVAAVAGESVQMQMRLAFVASRIANIRSSELYTCLRIEDRLEMQKLFARIVSWLDGGDHRAANYGQELWQDVRTFVSLLGLVNNRQELREHDRRLACEAYQRLFVNQPLTSLPEELRFELQKMLGRDDELDRLILSESPVPVERLEAPLRRVCTVLAAQQS